MNALNPKEVKKKNTKGKGKYGTSSRDQNNAKRRK